MEEKKKQGGGHPAHPVRDVLFCIFCVMLTLSFHCVWIGQLLAFPYHRIVMAVAALLLACALLGGVISFCRSHRAYFAYKRSKRK